MMEPKKLMSLDLKQWFYDKNVPLLMASVNVDYYYTIEKETEKAVQIKIINIKRSENSLKKDWFVWIPKSAIVEI